MMAGLVPGAVTEVGIERRLEVFSSREQSRTQLLQVGAALGERRGPVLQKGGALPGEQAGQCFRPDGGALLRRLMNDTAGDIEDRVCVERLRRHGTLTPRRPRPHDRTRAGQR